jgi:hypothetical protein
MTPSTFRYGLYLGSLGDSCRRAAPLPPLAGITGAVNR